MSTNNQPSKGQTQQNTTDEQRTVLNVDQNTVQALTQLINEPQSADTKSPEAQANATSITEIKAKELT